MTCVGLQETQFLFKARRAVADLKWYSVWSRDRAHCCSLWYRAAWQRLQQKIVKGERFVIVFFRHVAVISMYLPHKDAPGLDSEDDDNQLFQLTLGRVSDELRQYWSTYPGRPRATVLLTDANVEVAPHVLWGERVITGGGVCESQEQYRGGDNRRRNLRTEAMRRALVEFCGLWHIQLCNTFQTRSPTWRPSGSGSPQVLDYVGVPSTSHYQRVATTWVSLPGSVESHFSDHALVSTTFDLAPKSKRKRPKNNRTVSVAYWRPHSELQYRREADRQTQGFTILAPRYAPGHPAGEDSGVAGRRRPDAEMREEVEDGDGSSTETMLEDIVEEAGDRDDRDTEGEEDEETFTDHPGDLLARGVIDAALNVPHSRGRHNDRPRKSEVLWSMEEGMKQLRREGKWEECKELRRRYRPLKRQFQAALVRYEHRTSTRSKRRHTEVLEIPRTDGVAELSEDWEEWRKHLGDFGKSTVQDGFTRGLNQKVIHQCFEAVQSGAPGVRLPLSLVLQARSRLKMGGASSHDNVSPEMLQLLPWATVRRVQQLFQAVADRKLTSPCSWKRFLVTLIPKTPKTITLLETRKICLIPLMSKWYSLCLTILAEERLAQFSTNMGIYGFSKGRKPHEITSVLKRLSQHAALWGKQEALYVGSADVLQCFDHVTLELAHESLVYLGFPADLIYAMYARASRGQLMQDDLGRDHLGGLDLLGSVHTHGRGRESVLVQGSIDLSLASGSSRVGSTAGRVQARYTVARA